MREREDIYINKNQITYLLIKLYFPTLFLGRVVSTVIINKQTYYVCVKTYYVCVCLLCMCKNILCMCMSTMYV